jgi:hypothetical protein
LRILRATSHLRIVVFLSVDFLRNLGGHIIARVGIAGSRARLRLAGPGQVNYAEVAFADTDEHIVAGPTAAHHRGASAE